LGCFVAFIFLSVLLGIITALGMIAWNIEFFNPSGDETIVRPDEKPRPPKPMPVVDSKIQAFQEPWNIYDRFEYWPALLPLAEMSNIAYSLAPDAEKQFQQLGFSQCRAVSSLFHSQVAYVVSEGDVLVIACRGTDDAEDWFTNANMYLRDLPVGQIHTGFSGAYGMVQVQIIDEIEKRRPKHIWVTGHSLGGAMALTCAIDLELIRKIQIDGLFTFGQPMIGKSPLITSIHERLREKYVHFANERDIVPFMPLNFDHSGCLIRFFKGKVHLSKDYWQFATKSASPFDDLMEVEPIESLPVPSQQQIEQFNQKYKGEKAIPLMSPTKDGPTELFGEPSPNDIDDLFPDSGKSLPPMVGSIPYTDDHSMDLYVEKIRSAIERARKSDSNIFSSPK